MTIDKTLVPVYGRLMLLFDGVNRIDKMGTIVSLWKLLDIFKQTNSFIVGEDVKAVNKNLSPDKFKIYSWTTLLALKHYGPPILMVKIKLISPECPPDKAPTMRISQTEEKELVDGLRARLEKTVLQSHLDTEELAVTVVLEDDYLVRLAPVGATKGENDNLI